MPQNQKKKKRAKGSTSFKKKFVEADHNFNQEYAYVLKELGNYRFIIEIVSNSREIIADIKGSAKKQYWVKVGNLVLIEPIDGSSSEKYTIKVVYTSSEEKRLKKNGNLKKNIINNKSNNDNDDINIGNEINIKNNNDTILDENFINDICNIDI